MDGIIFTLTKRYQLCDSAIALCFDTEHDFTYTAGQHVSITIPEPVYTDDEGNSRYYSIANAPSKKASVMIVTRESKSAFNKNILTMNIGSEVFIKGPMGNLKIHEDKNIPAVFIAGGLGVTPFRSIIEEELISKTGREILLFYSNNTEASSPFMCEFEEWTKDNPNFKLIPAINDIHNKEWKYEYGLIDKRMLEKYIDLPGKPIFYIAGPPAMVEFVTSNLNDMEVPDSNIKTEQF